MRKHEKAASPRRNSPAPGTCVEATGRDDLFDTAKAPGAASFEFGPDVVRVFDDMVARSVPFYDAVQTLMAAIVLRCRAPGPICDLGCSTGATLMRLIEQTVETLDLVGIDGSEDMLDACRRKLAPVLDGHRLTLQRADLDDFVALPIADCGAMVLSLVAQFLRPLRRQALLLSLAQRIRPGGCLVMLEKTVQDGKAINAHFIECYHQFKLANGYNQVEVARKREALENRLIPFRPDENLAMLRKAGFAEVEIFFTWLNFQGYLALKG